MEPIRFNTGFIYEFGDEGIVSFGGKEYNIIDIDTVTWRKKDIPTVLVNLRRMEELLNLPEMNFESIPKNTQATSELVNSLVNQKYPREYIMGCAIYHQLQYKVPLEAVFESGMPGDYDYSDNEVNDMY